VPDATPDPQLRERADAYAEPVQNDDLRRALARLGENILNKSNR